MLLEEHIDNIFDGDSLLFLGAGFSRNTKNSNKEALPLTRDLSNLLQKLSGIEAESIDENLNVQQTSEYFIEKNGSEELVRLLKKQFTVTTSENWQNNLASLKWKRVYTTNYDNVFEVASNVAKVHRYAVDITNKDSINFGEDKKQIVHLNGFVDFIDSNNLMTSTKLTSQSYLDTYFLDGQWRNEFEIDIEHARSIFFVGFSLDYDLDLKRLIASNKKYREKIYFINGQHMSPITKNSLEKFGTVLEMDAEQFSSYLSKCEETYNPKNDNKIRTFSFTKREYSVINENVKDQDIANLFFWGLFDLNKMYTHIGSSSYIINRSIIDTIITDFDNYDLFVVHSSLGNGKTIFLKSIESILTKKGYVVYSFNGDPNKLMDDIEAISKIESKRIVITIDDYYSLKSEFKYFSKLSKNKFKFIVTGRSAVHNNIVSEFLRKGIFDDSKTRTVNLDKITSLEIDQLYELIENHNLWGEKSSDEIHTKKAFLKKLGKKGFKNIALELFKSNNIIESMLHLYNSLEDSMKGIVIASFINTILRSQLSLNQLLTLTDNTSLSKRAIDNPDFKEFLDVDNSIIILNSSIAAKELLKREKSKSTIVEIMEKMIKKADRIDSKKTYNYFKREMVSFSNFRLILSDVEENQLNDLAVAYYESIRNLKFTKNNPFFWLQYGIQKLNEKEYEVSDIFFDNALSYAGKYGLSDFYQINAQKARGIIERTIYRKTDSDVAYENFEKAHKLLLQDLNNSSNNKYYQLSQSIQYEPFSQMYYNQLTKKKKVSFIFKVSEMKKKVDEFIDFSKANQNPIHFKLDRAQKSLNRIIDEA